MALFAEQPHGNAFPAADIERLIRRFDGMVVLDEAYIDFASGPGFLARLDEFENLIVLQTLSKAWGMAGLRCGLAFAAGTRRVALRPREIPLQHQLPGTGRRRRTALVRHRRAGGAAPRRTRRHRPNPRRVPRNRTGLPFRSQLRTGPHPRSRPPLRRADRRGSHRPQPFARPGMRRVPAHHRRTPRRERPVHETVKNFTL